MVYVFSVFGSIFVNISLHYLVIILYTQVNKFLQNSVWLVYWSCSVIMQKQISIKSWDFSAPGNGHTVNLWALSLIQHGLSLMCVTATILLDFVEVIWPNIVCLKTAKIHSFGDVLSIFLSMISCYSDDGSQTYNIVKSVLLLWWWWWTLFIIWNSDF